MGVMVLKVLRQVCWCGGIALNPYAICPRLDKIHGWLGILIGSHIAEATVVGLTGIYFFCKSWRSITILHFGGSKVAMLLSVLLYGHVSL